MTGKRYFEVEHFRRVTGWLYTANHCTELWCTMTFFEGNRSQGKFSDTYTFSSLNQKGKLR